MATQKKVFRVLDLARWIEKAGKTGVSKNSIIAEYEISEKTVGRDIEEISQMFPLLEIEYDNEEERYFCRGESLKSYVKNENRNNSISNDFDDKVNIFKKNEDENTKDFYLIHIGDASSVTMGENGLNELLEAIVGEHVINFTYRKKQVCGLPIFFCFYSERWYLLCMESEGGIVKKYRIDFISNVSTPLITNFKTISSNDLKKRRDDIVNRIKRSKNIFIDLNTENEILIKFRFFLDYDYMKMEMLNIKKISNPDSADDSVTDVDMSFSCFYEAKIFMNKWLGSFQILSPENIRERYLGELEEAMDIL